MLQMHVIHCIDYCIQVFGNSINETQIAKLDKLQHRAAKVTTMVMKFTSNEKLFLDLGPGKTIKQELDIINEISPNQHSLTSVQCVQISNNTVA